MVARGMLRNAKPNALEPEISMALIGELGLACDAGIVDVGAGTSRLAERLLDAGFADITVLDVSARALELARVELGANAARVQWVEQDVLSWSPRAFRDRWASERDARRARKRRHDPRLALLKVLKSSSVVETDGSRSDLPSLRAGCHIALATAATPHLGAAGAPRPRASAP